MLSITNCAITLANAAPSTLIAGNPHHPKTKTKSSKTLIDPPIIAATIAHQVFWIPLKTPKREKVIIDKGKPNTRILKYAVASFKMSPLADKTCSKTQAEEK